MKYNMCTLFDKNFLFKGLALYNSISSKMSDFHLWILCIDDETHRILSLLKLPNVTLVSLSEIEDQPILTAKANRSFVEYLWTLSSNFPWWVLNKNSQIESVAYVDADLYFFDSPKTVYDQLGLGSVAIIPHRLLRRGSEEKYGKYNVGMLIFKNDGDGRRCLDWWRQECLNWCYNRTEDGLYGDQKYLDQFESRFKNVVSIDHKGACAAPWNISNYRVRYDGARAVLDEDPIIFFHFSGFKIYPKHYLFSYGPTNDYAYTRFSVEKKYIYRPYADALYNSLEMIKGVDKNFNYGLIERPNIRTSLAEFMHDHGISRMKYYLRPLKQYINL